MNKIIEIINFRTKLFFGRKILLKFSNCDFPGAVDIGAGIGQSGEPQYSGRYGAKIVKVGERSGLGGELRDYRGELHYIVRVAGCGWAAADS